MNGLQRRSEPQPARKRSLGAKLIERRWLIVGCIVTGWLIGTIAARVLPRRYRSETVILIEQQQVPEHLVEPNITMGVQQQRLQSTSKQVLSRTRLLALIAKFNLYAGEGIDRSPDSLIERMRKDIKIDLIESQGTRGELAAFQVSYSASSPTVARDVTTEIASQFIDETISDRRQLSEDTTNFLQGQLEIARQSLAGQEEKLKQFRSQSLGELPEQLQSNLAILTGLQRQLSDSNDALSRDEQHNLYLKSLYHQYQTSAAIGGAGSLTPHSRDSQLAALRGQLTDLTSSYTDRHPEVIRVKQQIARLEAEQAAAANSQTSQTTKVSLSATGAEADHNDNVPMIQLSSDLVATELQIANDKTKLATVEHEVNSYQARLNATPDREEKAAAVTRDYEQSRTYYETLLSKMLQSEMATELEKRQQNEHFRVIDAANLPNAPYFPNPLVFCAAGLVAGTMMGLAITFFLAAINPRLYSESELAEYIGSGYTLTLPVISTQHELSSARSRAWREAVAMGLIVIAIPTLTLLNYYTS
jgi:polysaccharide chain length determinant protein (PEP-CTERM system associated)